MADTLTLQYKLFGDMLKKHNEAMGGTLIEVSFSI